MAGGCCVFKFFQRSVDGKHLMRFQRKTSVFKFRQRSVEGALGDEYEFIPTVFSLPQDS